MERKQFTFYRSYLDAIRRLPKKEQGNIVLAICNYALDETIPSALSPIADQHGMTQEQAKTWLTAQGFASTKDIKQKDYDHLCDFLEEKESK